MNTNNEVEIKEATDNDNVKVYKTFKEYYKDEDWKKNHLEYMKTKVPCDCGRLVARSNMSNHKKTQIHGKRLAAMTDVDRAVYDNFYNEYMKVLKLIDHRLV